MTLDDYLKKYFETFGEGFPTYQIARTRTDDEIIDIIKKCLDEKKDAYSMGYASDNVDMYY